MKNVNKLNERLTIVIIAHNEAKNLLILLPQLNFAKKILVINNNSDDETAQIAREAGADVLSTEISDFAGLRNLALQEAKTDWIFYLDADERVSKLLQEEIQAEITRNEATALILKRENYCYGFQLTAGGWENDYVTRIFQKDALHNWQGEIHESPNFVGKSIKLKNNLFHLTHRNTAANLLKSSQWTIKEATLLANAGIKIVTKITILRKVILEFYRRYFRDHGYRDGMVGFVESLTQAFNRGFVYMQVWELQQKPNLETRYAQIENKLQEELD